MDNEFENWWSATGRPHSEFVWDGVQLELVRDLCRVAYAEGLVKGSDLALQAAKRIDAAFATAPAVAAAG